MRYLPSDRHASLLLSALRETVHAHSVASEVSGATQTNVTDHLEARESEDGNEAREEKDYTTVDHEISEYFLKWGQALEAGDEVQAKRWEERIDALAEDHPFSYKKTKELYYDFQQKSSYAAALENYRAWDGTDTDFGIVKATIPGDARVGIFGDWGTGTDDAGYLFEAMMAHSPDVLLHLGDIYEAGTPYECRKFFLEPMEEACHKNGWKRPPILTLPGNHEYFTAGVGYYELIDVLNSDHGDEWKQDASFFCLRSADGKWQFLGADSEIRGIEEESQPGLEPSELAWHQDKLKSFRGRNILLFHHQFVSADQIINSSAAGTDFQYFNKNLVEGFMVPVNGGPETYFDRIDQMIWGHDHWFVPYVNDLTIPVPGRSGLKLKRGQLLGGSARETGEHQRNVKFASSVQQKNGEFVLPRVSNDDLYYHTYGIIDLAAATASYYQVPAWLATNPNPDKTLPSEPLHVEQL